MWRRAYLKVELLLAPDAKEYEVNQSGYYLAHSSLLVTGKRSAK